MSIKKDPRVKAKFKGYPKHIRPKMQVLRNLILQTAQEVGCESVEETLKWGEPSYITKHGSTIRMDWKEKSPNQYALYFNCNSRLVETFRFVYGSTFQYEKNRAVIFNVQDTLSIELLKQCLAMALQYHKLKDQPLLGA